MSLVEQAIAKLREAAGVDERATSGPARSAIKAAVLQERLEDTARNTRIIEVDLALMRDSGYLPEAGIERQFAEHYRQIKRPLVERALKASIPATVGDPRQDPRVIMITSALPGEGKSFTSVNLALSLARERDISVLLVDADILKPRTSEIFGVKQELGLMDALRDDEMNIESLVLGTNIRGLAILPAGHFIEGAAELLLSDRMRRLLSSLLGANPRRLVVLDSPPLLPTSEGRALTKVAGQVVLVVRSGQTPVHALKDAIGLLDSGSFGGVIVNEAHMSLTESFYGYGAYGYTKDEQTRSG